MGCGCSDVKKESYSILDVMRDELLGQAEKVSDYKKAKRLLKCYSCERLIAPTKQCRECGCFVKAKVVYEKSSCPLARW